MLWLKLLFLLQFGILALCQSHSCSYQDETTGYSISWTAGVGFVDFFFNFKNFPTRTPHWTGLGFGDGTLQVALIESQAERVTISSAAMYAAQPPLKLPTANMVTRGYGSIDEERLRASFSVPIYYFKNCETWTFFTIPTQVGMPYSGTPPTRTLCNITNLCVTPKISHSYKAYPDQSSAPTSLNIQIPGEVSKFLEQPLDADIDIKGGLHVNSNQNSASVRFSPQQQQQNGQTQFNYDQQYGYTPNQFGRAQFDQSVNDQSSQNGQQYGQNQQSQYGQNQQSQYGQNQQFGQSQQFGQPPYYQQQASGAQSPYYNQNGYFNNAGSPSNNQGFYDTRNPSANSQNGFTVDNPNYKFLPDGIGQQYEANSGRQRFYDSNGNPVANNQYGATDDQIRSNADQNRVNYQDINSRGTPQSNSNQYTNNIYGYDYRSNPGNKYTINGNEQQYQPPQNQRYTNGRRKKRQTFQGTAYQGQDAKFPRTENTVPTSGVRDDPTPNFNTGSNNFNGQKAYYDSQNVQGGMYYPYQTNVGPTLADYQRQYYQNTYNGFSTYTTSNQFDPNSQIGPLAPYYVNSNSQVTTNNDGLQFDTNPYSTTNYNPASPYYKQTSGLNSFNSSNGQFGTINSNINSQLNSANHQDIHQYDDPNCQGSDPPFCKDYVKKFQEGSKAYPAGQSQSLCSALKQSLYHIDHHCCESLKNIGCL